MKFISHFWSSFVVPNNLALHRYLSERLYRADIPRLVIAHRGKSNCDLATNIWAYFAINYPTSAWVVTVYDPIGLFENHIIVSERSFVKFRYYGYNIAVTRFPRSPNRSNRAANSTIVGSITGRNARKVARIIEGRFQARGESFTSIHVVRRGELRSSRGLYTAAAYVPGRNIFFKKFPHVHVIVVAPRSFNL